MCSVALSCACLLGASKIAPHSVRLLAERRVLPFEFFEGHTRISLAVGGRRSLFEPRVRRAAAVTLNFAVFEIFLCHSSADRETAHTIAARLERNAEAHVSLEECGSGTRETIATAWEAGLSSAGILLLFGPDAVPHTATREAWNGLLAHVEANADPPLASVVTAPCGFPRLLERKHCYRWSDNRRETLRAVERWALSARSADDAASFSPARQPWFAGRSHELDQLWELLVDSPGTVALVNDIPGSGKTSLAHEFARAAAGHFRDVVRFDCTDRSAFSLASELAVRLEVSLDGPADEALERLDSIARKHRVLLFFDNVTGPLPLRDSTSGRASILITTRDEHHVPAHSGVAVTFEPVAVSPPEAPRDADELRLWHAVQSCRVHDFPLALAASICGLDATAANDACERLSARRCVDANDWARGRFRLSAPAIAVCGLGSAELPPLRYRHAEELASVFARWRENPVRCADYLTEAESAFAWASCADWPLARRIADAVGSWLKAEARLFAAADWYRQFVSAAEAVDDEAVISNCLWELSWLENDSGGLRQPPSSGAQLALDF
jgi:hypothetical protein